MSFENTRMSPSRSFAEDHLRTLKMQLLEYQKQGYLTDLNISTASGIVSVHKAMICSVLPGLRNILEGQTVGEDVVLILPGEVVDNVAKAVEEVYLKSDITNLSHILDIDRDEKDISLELNKVSEDKKIPLNVGCDVKIETGIVDNKDKCIQKEEVLDFIETDLDDSNPAPNDSTTQETDFDKSSGFLQTEGNGNGSHSFIMPSGDLWPGGGDLLKDEFGCNKCQKSFVSALDLRRHKIWKHQNEQKPVVHFGKTRHVCDICGASFFKASGLSRHNTRIHQAAKSKRQRPKKLKPKSSPEAFICELCPRVFDAHSKLDNHMDLNHRPVECPVCKKTISNKYNLNMHMKNHSGENKVTCDVCGMQLSAQQLRPHFLAKHTNERPHKCALCDFGTVTKQALRRHIDAYHNNIKYPCTICGLQFCDKASLGVHERTVHNDARNFICKICNKGFKLNAKMQRHILNSHGNKDFICKICNKGFTSKEYLLNHEKSHNEENQYKCTYCTKSFVTRQKLTEHIYSHTGEKPFLCPSFRCDRRFNSSSSLAHHKKACAFVQVQNHGRQPTKQDGALSSSSGFSSEASSSYYE